MFYWFSIHFLLVLLTFYWFYLIFYWNENGDAVLFGRYLFSWVAPPQQAFVVSVTNKECSEGGPSPPERCCYWDEFVFMSRIGQE